MIIPDAAPKISNDKKSLNSRHILPLSFLSRKKRKQKKVDFRRVFFAAPAVFTNLQHKTDGSHTNRLLFFLEEKKQKKINGGRAASLRSSRFRQPATQNGRFTYEPSVFSFQAGRAGKRLFLEKHPPPQCLLFLFFKKRKRTPSRKENVPLQEKKSSPQRAPSYLPKMRFSSDGGSVAFGTKVGAAVASDGAAVPTAAGVGAASAGPP